jgi:SsrA-binding protein
MAFVRSGPHLVELLQRGEAPVQSGSMRTSASGDATAAETSRDATNRKASTTLHPRALRGASLVGSEVKSLRDAKVTMADGWVEIRKGQAYLHGIQINEYSQANRWQHEVARVRKLLMHKHEIARWARRRS